MMSEGIPFIDAATLRGAITDVEAVAAVRQALAVDLIDPEAETPRTVAGLHSGHLLLMPSELGELAGVKIASVAPGNPAFGLPRIQGLYLLLDGRQLSPLATIDAVELTLIRTPAVTAFAVSALLELDPRFTAGSIDRLMVIGSGPQAERHVRALTAALTVGDVAVAARRSEAVADLVGRLAGDGIRARPAAEGDLGRADVVVTATSSSDPVFDDRDLGERVIVAAVGAHGLEHREVPVDFARRAHVVVESVGSALRESGDLIPARSAADWESRLSTLADLARGRLPVPGSAPVLYTGVGMAWEDLAIARAVWRKRGRTARMSRSRSDGRGPHEAVDPASAG